MQDLYDESYDNSSKYQEEGESKKSTMKFRRDGGG